MLKNIDSLKQRLDVGCLRLPSFTMMAFSEGWPIAESRARA